MIEVCPPLDLSPPIGLPTPMTNVSRGVVKDEPSLTHSIGEMADLKSGSGISAFAVLPPGENMHVRSSTLCALFLWDRINKSTCT